MKKGYINFLAACTAIVFAAACVKEETPSTNPEEEAVAYEDIIVSASSIVTKTVMVSDDETSNQVEWCQGDDISAFSTNVAGGSNNKLSSNNAEQAFKTTFKGVIEEGTTGVVVLYPYDASATFSQSDKVLGTTIPTEQTATVSSFGNGAAVTVAQGPKVSREVELVFKHLCSVLEFTVPAGINASQIKIESINSAVKMTGAVTVDCSTAGNEAITSATNNYVILNGTFTSEKSYCVTVAPGDYDQGFKFTINTKGNNSYYRVAKPLETKAGCLYKLGTPSYEFDESNVTVEAAIVPTYENMAVTGSTATLTVSTNIPDEFKDLVSGWTLQNVVFSQNGVDFRKTTSTTFTSGTPVEIAATDGHPYMPHSVGEGKYTYTADICYKVNGKDHKLTVNGTATAPALDPDKFEIKFDFAGYTTLSVAKGYDRQTKDVARANSLDNSTVWGVGDKTYQSGLGSDVYTQCANPLLVCSATKYDGSSVSGTDVTYEKQTWAAHTISCDVSFDGVAPTKQPSKQVHVTGLPHAMTFPADAGDHPWRHYKGTISFESDRTDMSYHPTELEPIIQSPNFYLPEETDVRVTGDIRTDATGSVGNALELKPNGEKDKYNHKPLNDDHPWSGTFDYTMSKGSPWIEIQHHNSNAFKTTSVYAFYVKYR